MQNNNFNHQMGQQPPMQQQFNQQNQNGNPNTPTHHGGYTSQPSTPTGFGPGYQNTGNFTFMPQQQLPNPRTPGSSGGGMPMQNTGFGNMNVNPQVMPYSQSQQNSPAPTPPVAVKPPGGAGDMASVQNQTPPSASGAFVPQSPQQQKPQPQQQQQPTQQQQQQQQQQQLQQQQQQQQVAQQAPKEVNAASFCRLGQETVQEFVNKIHEMFGTLKQTQPPDGKMFTAGVDRKQKLNEMLRAVKGLLKRLRIIYDKVEEVFPSSEDMDEVVQSLIPYLDGGSVNSKVESRDIEMEREEHKNTDAYRQALEEYREVQEQVTLKNRQLKETIDHLRQIIWDVNTMLAMRKD